MSAQEFPLFQGILPFDRSKLMPEIVAGITLAALGIPEVMGYTKIIGTPVITGLYTLLLPVLAYAIFGSSRHLVVAADSATAAMVSAALASYAGGPQYVALTSLVALVAGGLLLLARVLRLGFLADFLSRTVLVGFLTGVGAQVAFAQLPGVLGLENGGEGFWGHVFFTAKHLRDIDPASVSIALCVLAVIVGLRVFRSPLSRRPVGRGRNERGQRHVPLGKSRHKAGRRRPQRFARSLAAERRLERCSAGSARRLFLLHRHLGPKCRHFAGLCLSLWRAIQ